LAAALRLAEVDRAEADLADVDRAEPDLAEVDLADDELVRDLDRDEAPDPADELFLPPPLLPLPCEDPPPCAMSPLPVS